MVKQAFIILAILFSINANAQTKKDTVATNNTPLLTVVDIAKVDSVLQKKINRFELADYQQVAQMLQLLINERAAIYNKENKPAAKKP